MGNLNKSNQGIELLTPWKINTKNPTEKKNHLNQTSILEFYVNFPGCTVLAEMIKLSPD